ncbi:MAG: LEA type 2 family protein [Bacteroidia bacterium]|nr:LEA type 2 family protein [Bacteroidia bacterium]
MKKIGLALNIVILFLLAGCKPLQTPIIKGLDGYKVNKMKASDMEIILNLRIENPNDYKIVLADYDLDITLNGLSIGKAKAKENVVFEPNKENSYPFTIHTDLKSVLAQILPSLSLFTGGKQIELKLNGYIRAKAHGIGKKIPIQLEQKIDMSKLLNQ